MELEKLSGPSVQRKEEKESGAQTQAPPAFNLSAQPMQKKAAEGETEAKDTQKDEGAVQLKAMADKPGTGANPNGGNGPIQAKMANEGAAVQRKEDPLKVNKGQVTFDAEGNDVATSQYFSRTIHWPGGVSGVTIGRGYDLGQRTKKEVEGHLATAGITGTQASILIGGIGKTGKSAGEYVTSKKKSFGAITHDQQKKLFDIAYNQLSADVERISKKDDVVEKYGAVDFKKLHPAIRDVVVDLRYRGDYHRSSREWIQPLMVKNDLKGMATAMADARWKTQYGVPKDRFDRRKQFMADAVAGKTGNINQGGEKETKPDPTPTAAIGTGVVNADSLNVRSGPSTNHKTVGTPLKKGAKVTIFQQADGWYNIGEGRWISGKFTTFTPGKKADDKGETKDEKGPTTTYGTVTAGTLNVRKGPATTFGTVGEPLKEGAKVTLYEEKNGWFRIGEGRWVSGKYIKQSATPPKADETKEQPKTQTGTVTASSLNVRSGPDASAAKVGPPLSSGAKVTIYEERNGWYRIGKDQWVSAKYVNTGSGAGNGGGGSTSMGPKPSWISVAEGEIGVQENTSKTKHNPRVIEYHSTTGKFKDDETPWCASFANWVLKKSGQAGTGSAMALSFKNYGQKAKGPGYGAIAVFSYGGGKGHVGFVVGKSGSNLLVLGGNQGNSVKVSSFKTDQIVAYRYPDGYSVPDSAYSLGQVKGDHASGGGAADTR